LEIQILGDSKSAERALNRIGPSVKKMAAGVALGQLAVRGLDKAWRVASGAFKTGVAELMDQQKATAQTNAVLKSTGSIANVTARQVQNLAETLSRKSGIDDEQIQSAENWILTFKNVRNEVGANNDIFTQAASVTVDLGVAMANAKGGTVNLGQASNMLGRALNDPVKGLTALSRAGVQFSEGQKKTITSMVESGNLMGAQKLMLKELRSQVGGSAEAYGRTLPGAISRLRETWKNLAGDLVGRIAPAFANAVDQAQKFIDRITKAKGMRAKLAIVWEGIEAAGRGIQSALRQAIAKVNWTAVWAGATGIAAGLQSRFEAIDWSAVGEAMANGIVSALKTGGPVALALMGALSDMAMSIDWEALGMKMGPGLATAILVAFDTLTDVSFWARHWTLALSIAVVAFGGLIGKALKPLGAILKTKLAAVFWDAMVAIERTMGTRAASIILALSDGIARSAGLIAVGVKKLYAWLDKEMDHLGRLGEFTIRVLGIETAIKAIGQFASWTIGKLQDLARKMEQWALKAALVIVEPFSHIPKRLGGGWAQDLKAKIKGQLASMEPSVASQAAQIGTSLINSMKWEIFKGAVALAAAVSFTVRKAIDQGNKNVGSTAGEHARDVIGVTIGRGIIEGFLLGSRDLPSKISEKLRASLEHARTVVEGYSSKMSDAFSKVGDKALQAFDAHTSKLLDNIDKTLAKAIAKLKVTVSGSFGTFDFSEGAETPSEKILREETEARDEKARQDALTEAIASGDAQAIDAAQWAIRQASLQKKADQERAAGETSLATAKANLEAKAEAEKLNLQSSRDLERDHLEAQLAQLQVYLEKHPKAYKKVLKKLKKLFADEWGPSFELAGKNLGLSFATGLEQSFKALAGAAEAFAKVLAKYLEGKSPPKYGPLSKIDKWGENLGLTYAKAINLPGIAASIAGTGLGAIRSNAAAGAMAGRAVQGGGNTYIINVPLSNVWGKDPDAVALEVRERIKGLERQGFIPDAGFAS
jgi:hypothetical protein